MENAVSEKTENRTNQKDEENRGIVGFWKKYYIYILATGIPALIMLAVWIHAKIGPGGRSLIIIDGLHQYMPFFSEYYEKLKHGENLFYSFEVGMGTNFLSLWTYYLASPMNLLILLFPKSQLNTAVSLIVTIKIIFSAWSFAYAALHRNHVKYRHPGVIPLAIAYSMSNYVVGFYWNVMWMDCIMIFPLIILGFDYLVEKKDPRLYIGTLFYALFCNYYIGFMICIFLVMWAILYRFENLKQLGRTAATFAVSSLLAGGLAAVVLVPAYMGIMQTASAKRVLPGLDQYGSYFDIIQAHFIGIEPINNQVFDGGVNLYCGLFALFLLFIFLFSKEFKVFDRIRYVIILAVLFISFNTELLNYIWHGFHNQYGIPNRFAFLYIFVLLWIAYEVLLRYRRIHPGVIVASCIICLGLTVACYYKASEPLTKNHYLIIASIFLVYAIVSLLYRYMEKHGKVWRAILAGIMSVEMIAGSLYGWNQNGTIDVEYYFSDTEQIAEIKNDLYTEDSSFYRMELGKAKMLDEATWHNMRCVSLFGSTALGNMVTGMGRMGFYTGANEYLYRGATPLTNAIIGMKYVLYRDGDFNNNTLFFKQSYDGISVYENPYILPIGFAVNRKLLDTEMYGTYFDVQNEYARDATGIEAPLFVSKSLDMLVGGVECTASIDDNKISYSDRTTKEGNVQMTVYVHENMDLYMDISGGNVKQVKVYMDDQLLGNDRYQGQAFHVGYVTEGQELTFEFTFNDNSESGVITIHAAAFQDEAWSAVYSKLQERGMQVTEYGSNYFKGMISVKENQAVFFSIPCEDGWSVYIDGEKVENQSVFNAFLAVDVPEGEHSIELKYTSQGFYFGIILSVISLIFLILFLMLLKYVNKKYPDGIIKEKVKKDNPEEEVIEREEQEVQYEEDN